MSYDSGANINYYHGTAPQNVEHIISEGFRLPFCDDGEGLALKVETLLGHGVYISRSWRTALWFNRALLRVQLAPNTRVLDVSALSDMKIIDRLKREFGRKLLQDKAIFHQIIPRNKHLTCHETIELTKYHYHRTWGRQNRKRFHHQSLNQCWRLLKQYKYDGFGHSTSDLGIIVLSPNKIVMRELIAVVRKRPLDRDERKFESISNLKKYFQKNGEKRYKQLAEHINAEKG